MIDLKILSSDNLSKNKPYYNKYQNIKKIRNKIGYDY